MSFIFVASVCPADLLNIALCYLLLDHLDPALRSLNTTHLDTCQCLIQLLGDRSHLLHAAREADLLTMIIDLANRRDYCCSTAKTTLCEILNLIKIYFSLLNFKTKILLGYDQQGTTCDRRQDTVGLRCNDLIILCNKQDIGSSGLLNLCTGASTMACKLIA